MQPKGLFPEGTPLPLGNIWSVGAMGARAVVNGGILHPLSTAALSSIWGEEGGSVEPSRLIFHPALSLQRSQSQPGFCGRPLRKSILFLSGNPDLFCFAISHGSQELWQAAVRCAASSPSSHPYPASGPLISIQCCSTASAV